MTWYGTVLQGGTCIFMDTCHLQGPVWSGSHMGNNVCVDVPCSAVIKH